MTAKRAKYPLNDGENARLIRMCSLAAQDPHQMYEAILKMFNSLDDPQDREYLKLRLRLTGEVQ